MLILFSISMNVYVCVCVYIRRQPSGINFLLSLYVLGNKLRLLGMHFKNLYSLTYLSPTHRLFYFSSFTLWNIWINFILFFLNICINLLIFDTVCVHVHISVCVCTCVPIDTCVWDINNTDTFIKGVWVQGYLVSPANYGSSYFWGILYFRKIVQSICIKLF